MTVNIVYRADDNEIAIDPVEKVDYLDGMISDHLAGIRIDAEASALEQKILRHPYAKWFGKCEHFFKIICKKKKIIINYLRPTKYTVVYTRPLQSNAPYARSLVPRCRL